MTPDLLNQPRFTQPENWRWHFFKSSSGHKIRFGSVFPKDKIPDAVILCLPGFREFSEKYFELSRDMLGRNFAFWTLDWLGQGESDHILPDPLKAHSLGFEQNIADLKQFIFDYVKPASVHPDVGRLPVILIGHSMGAHVGLRYLHENPEDFIRAAAFSAPMVAVRQFAKYPLWLTKFISQYCRIVPTRYLPGHDEAAGTAQEIPPGKGIYSSDPERDQLRKAWFEKSEKLRIKGPTYKWLYETLKSCAILQKKSYIQKITTPVLIAVAGKDYVVSSEAAEKLASYLPNGELLNFPDAQHEIFIERDEIRNEFLARFDEFTHRTVLSRQDRLKKF